MDKVAVLCAMAVCIFVTAVSAGAAELPAGMKMVDIPGGTFEMASTSETVNVGDFSLSETEVTWGQYCEFLNNKQPLKFTRKKWIALSDEENPSHIYKENGVYYVDEGWSDHPAVTVTKIGANAFCDYYGLRLPEETEWEYAAGGPDHTKFPWGNTFDGTKCCYKGNRGDGNPKTLPVRSFPKNGYGLYDMAGNAAEWCSGSDGILRGGSWADKADDIGCARGFTGAIIAMQRESKFRMAFRAAMDRKLKK